MLAWRIGGSGDILIFLAKKKKKIFQLLRKVKQHKFFNSLERNINKITFFKCLFLLPFNWVFTKKTYHWVSHKGLSRLEIKSSTEWKGHTAPAPANEAEPSRDFLNWRVGNFEFYSIKILTLHYFSYYSHVVTICKIKSSLTTWHTIIMFNAYEHVSLHVRAPGRVCTHTSRSSWKAMYQSTGLKTLLWKNKVQN